MTKTFTYQSRRDGWFWLTTSTILLAILFFIVINALTLNGLTWKLIIPIFVLGPISIIPLLVLAARLRLNRIDCLRNITVNQTARTLEFRRDGYILEISYQDIEEVEIHQSYSATPLLSDLGYTKLKLTDGRSFIIPKLTATPSDLRNLIDSKKCRTVTRLVNMF